MGKRSKAKKTGSKNPGSGVRLMKITSKTIDVEPDIDPTTYKDRSAQQPYSGSSSAVPGSSNRRSQKTHYRR